MKVSLWERQAARLTDALNPAQQVVQATMQQSAETCAKENPTVIVGTNAEHRENT